MFHRMYVTNILIYALYSLWWELAIIYTPSSSSYHEKQSFHFFYNVAQVMICQPNVTDLLVLLFFKLYIWEICWWQSLISSAKANICSVSFLYTSSYYKDQVFSLLCWHSLASTIYLDFCSIINNPISADAFSNSLKFVL